MCRCPRILVACLCSLGLVGSLFLYGEFGASSMFVNVCLLVVVGAFLFGADTLLGSLARCFKRSRSSR